MNRYVFRRLTLIPRVLVAVNFFGFAMPTLCSPANWRATRSLRSRPGQPRCC